MTSSIHFDDFLLTFERSLERVLSSASNSSSSPNDSSTGTSGINHSEIELNLSANSQKSNSINYDEKNISKVLDVGSWEYISKGKKIAVLATGSMVDVATNSIDLINEKFNFIPTVVNCRFIKPFDIDCLNEIIKSHDLIITMEEGALKGGFGSSILDYCKRDNVLVESMGIQDFFVEHGTRQELLDLVGLNINSLINLIDDYMNDKLGDN